MNELKFGGKYVLELLSIERIITSGKKIDGF